MRGMIEVQPRGMIYRVTVPEENVAEEDLTALEADFKVATGYEVGIVIGDKPRNEGTTDLFAKVTYRYNPDSKISFNFESIQPVLLTVFRLYFEPHNNQGMGAENQSNN